MSFKIVEQAPARLNRSELAVPGSQPQLFEKAAKSAADVVFLDLEDAVAPDDKPQARKNVIQALRDIDWGRKTMSVRINGLDTHFMYRDVVDVMEQAGERLDLIMIPKVGTAADVYAVDMLVTQCEAAIGRKKRIGFEMIIETALGMQNVHEIAAASKRNESLHFGVADYAASTRARTTNIGGANPDYSVLTDKARRRRARGPLGRYVALRHRPHGGRRARQWAAPRRRALRRFLRCRWLSRRGQSRRRAGLRGQMGDPSLPGGARQRAVQPERQGGGQGPAHPGRHGPGAEGGQGRGRARRPPDRSRLHPPGRGAGEEGRAGRGPASSMPTFLEFEKPIAELEGKIEELRHLANGDDMNIAEEVAKLQGKADRLLRQTYGKLTAWQKTLVARHPDRPHFGDYVGALVEEWTPLAGDRNFADDRAILGGLGPLPRPLGGGAWAMRRATIPPRACATISAWRGPRAIARPSA